MENLSFFDEDKISRSSKKYKENCLERAERENVSYKIQTFIQLQHMSYDPKLIMRILLLGNFIIRLFLLPAIIAAAVMFL